MITRDLRDSIDSLREELIMLCEIRGELSPEDNAKTEQRIRELEAKLSIGIRKVA
jgi:hypothetical protein